MGAGQRIIGGGQNIGNADLTISSSTRTLKLGGDLSTDTFDIQTNGGVSIMEFAGDKTIFTTGLVGIGASPSTSQALNVYSTSYTYGLKAQINKANGYAIFAVASINNNSTALRARNNTAGGTGTRYGVDVEASGGSNNYAFYVRAGDYKIAYSDVHKILLYDDTAASGFAVTNYLGTTKLLSADGLNNVSAGAPSLATDATDGFLYIPSCAGTPTGTPTGITGMIPIVADSTNNILYIYSGGSWVALN